MKDFEVEGPAREPESAEEQSRVRHFLETQGWPLIPEAAKRPWTREEEDEALGYGEAGQPV